MKDMLPRLTREINRRTLLRRTAATGFGILAGAAVGAPRSVAAAYKIPCGPNENCLKHNSEFCNGWHCGGSGLLWECHPQDRGCGSAGGAPYCWRSGGGKCCDCKCNVFVGGGYTFTCICYG